MKTKITLKEYIIRVLLNQPVASSYLYAKDRKRYDPKVLNGIIFYKPQCNYNYRQPLVIFNSATKQAIFTLWRIKKDVQDVLANWEIFNISYDNIRDIIDYNNSGLQIHNNTKIYNNLIERYPKQNVNIVLLYHYSRMQLQANNDRNKFISGCKRHVFINNRVLDPIIVYSNLFDKVNGIIQNTIFNFYLPEYRGWSRPSYDHLKMSMAMIFRDHRSLLAETTALIKYNNVIDQRIVLQRVYVNLLQYIQDDKIKQYTDRRVDNHFNISNIKDRIRFGSGGVIQGLTYRQYITNIYDTYTVPIQDLKKDYIDSKCFNFTMINYLLFNIASRSIYNNIFNVLETVGLIRIDNCKEYSNSTHIRIIGHNNNDGIYIITSSQIKISLTYITANDLIEPIDNATRDITDGYVQLIVRHMN